MSKSISKIITTYKGVTGQAQRKGRTVPCKVCGNPYTDNISAEAVEITCARCTMGLADAPPPEVQIDADVLVDAIKKEKVRQYRKSLGLTQDDLAGRIGITVRHLRSIENCSYIPSSKAIRKIEKRLKNFRPPQEYP